MNKWQLVILGVMIVGVIFVLYATPLSLGMMKNTDYWEDVARGIIPILLIGGFLILVLKKKK